MFRSSCIWSPCESCCSTRIDRDSRSCEVPSKLLAASCKTVFYVCHSRVFRVSSAWRILGIQSCRVYFLRAHHGVIDEFLVNYPFLLMTQIDPPMPLGLNQQSSLVRYQPLEKSYYSLSKCLLVRLGSLPRAVLKQGRRFLEALHCTNFLEES